MRFAILGNHPDGWAVARAMIGDGHELVAHDGQHVPSEMERMAPAARREPDIEEVLADPEVDAVIVASGPGARLNQLRRVLQSERHALCVHPVDERPDGAYEMNLLQGDVHRVVLPLLGEAALQGIAEIQQRIQQARSDGRSFVLDICVSGQDQVLSDGRTVAATSFRIWTLLRRLAGEVAEVEALAEGDEVSPGVPVLIQGRFADGGLFRAIFRPDADHEAYDVGYEDSAGTLGFDARAIGPGAEAIWQSIAGFFGDAVRRMPATPRAAPGAGRLPTAADELHWMDEVRSLELDDAARRSLERRRATALDYQEASEEVGFKGTMTLLGCGLLWSILGLLILSAWFPQVGWLIAPVLFGFLGLQLLRWLVPRSTAAPRSGAAVGSEDGRDSS